MGMLQEFIANEGDGWSYSLSALRDYFHQAEARVQTGEAAPVMELPLMDASRQDPPAAMAAMAGEYLRSIRTLGRRTAEFHLALSEEKKNPAFKPEKSTVTFTEQLAESVIRQIQEVLPMLNARITDLPVEARENGELVLSEAPVLLDWVGQVAEVGAGLGQLIRHHGDYHLGQVLLIKKEASGIAFENGCGDGSESDFILLDFEGEPLRPLAGRRRKGSPLKDVAGMIRSFHYAAETALAAATAAAEAGERREELVPWSRAWYEWTSRVFIGAYFQTAAGASFLPTADAGFILEVFLLEKAFYELRYEMNNRPAWVHIPLAGIVAIIDEKRRAKGKNKP
jgi:maltose alpha-D-glucosyltransferase/alpha-amylase